MFILFHSRPILPSDSERHTKQTSVVQYLYRLSIHLRSKVESFGNKNSNRFVSVIVYFAFRIATRNEPRNTRPLSFGIKPVIWKTCCLGAYQLNSLSVSLYSETNYFLFILKRLVLMPSASFFPRIRHLWIRCIAFQTHAFCRENPCPSLLVFSILTEVPGCWNQHLKREGLAPFSTTKIY